MAAMSLQQGYSIQQDANNNFNYNNADSDYHNPRSGHLGNCAFHPPMSMESKYMQLFWLLLVMGSYKILQLFASLLFASTVLKISQSMGSDNLFKALRFPFFTISSSFDIKDLQSMRSIKYITKPLFIYLWEYILSPLHLSLLKGTPPSTERATR